MERADDRRDPNRGRNLLVVLGGDAEPPILVDALRPRAAGTSFTLLVPATSPSCSFSPAFRHKEQPDGVGGWLEALERAERAARALREAGLEVRETIVGDADLAAATGDVMHAREVDDVVVLVDPEAPPAARPDLVGV